jgi:hypothetical protein
MDGPRTVRRPGREPNTRPGAHLPGQPGSRPLYATGPVNERRVVGHRYRRLEDALAGVEVVGRVHARHGGQAGLQHGRILLVRLAGAAGEVPGVQDDLVERDLSGDLELDTVGQQAVIGAIAVANLSRSDDGIGYW